MTILYAPLGGDWPPTPALAAAWYAGTVTIAAGVALAARRRADAHPAPLTVDQTAELWKVHHKRHVELADADASDTDDDDEWKPCHEYIPGPDTTEAVIHACGRCGGDKRRPTEVAPEVAP